MTQIKSYEEALKVLGKEKPAYLDDMPKNEQAYHKLCTIAEVLNLGHEDRERWFYPWWYEGGLRDSEECYCNPIYKGEWKEYENGFRLCCFDRDTTLYFGSEPFIKLWQEYLL